MIFKVSEKLKGSIALPTLNQAIWAKMTVCVSGNDLRANDIRDVIKKGILVPINDKYDEEDMQKDHDVIIVNNTDQVLVLGDLVLRPNGSLPISKEYSQTVSIIAAGEKDIITIISDEGDKPYIKKKKVAEKAPKTEDFTQVDKEENDDLEFVEDLEVKKVSRKKADNKKTVKKKTTKNKVSAKKKTKKKEITSKKKKIKTLEPVGEKKLPKTEFDAAMELDSRGNPICEKPGDTLKHLIDRISSPEDVNFADNEQKLERYNNRTDME